MKDKNLYFIEWLSEDNGYAIFQEYDNRDMPMEYMLVRCVLHCNDDDTMTVSNIEELFTSKFINRIKQRFEIIKKQKGYIMEVEETLKNLTIPQLESLLPSYYQCVIERRIKELKQLEAEKKVEEAQPIPIEESLAQPKVKKTRKKKNANTSTKRKSKKTTESTN